MIEVHVKAPIERQAAPQTERDHLEHFGKMPFEFFRPLLLSFRKRPFRSREAPQPARYRKQNSKFEGKRAPEKSTCGGCEERQTKPRVEKPCNRCRRGQARLPYYLDKGLFPSWGNRAGRPLLRNAASRLDK